VDLLQSWMIVGVPGVALALGLFSGRNKLRAWFGFGVLAALAVFFVTVPGDPISAVAVGIVLVGFVATGRGTHTDDEFQEHHVDRKRFTTVRDDEPVGP
jgi:MFS superfamily sulfate permease-like transporter